MTCPTSNRSTETATNRGRSRRSAPAERRFRRDTPCLRRVVLAEPILPCYEICARLEKRGDFPTLRRHLDAIWDLPAPRRPPGRRPPTGKTPAS